MSSFIGHGLTALAIGKGFSDKAHFKQPWMWAAFLVCCAWVPDIDYLLNRLNAPNNGGLRITHSIVFSLVLPVFGMLYLSIFDRKNVFWGGLQASFAGLSHLLLDTLVGSKNADPLFYPFFSEMIGLPFGILPSAGAIKLSNYYFYRNLLIECGILVPAFWLILSAFGKVKLNPIGMALSVVSLLIFLIWGINLTR